MRFSVIDMVKLPILAAGKDGPIHSGVLRFFLLLLFFPLFPSVPCREPVKHGYAIGRLPHLRFPSAFFSSHSYWLERGEGRLRSLFLFSVVFVEMSIKIRLRSCRCPWVPPRPHCR